MDEQVWPLGIRPYSRLVTRKWQRSHSPWSGVGSVYPSVSRVGFPTRTCLRNLLLRFEQASTLDLSLAWRQEDDALGPALRDRTDKAPRLQAVNLSP